MELVFLGHDRFVDALERHVCVALVHSIDSEERVALLDLLLAQFANIFNRVIARVFGERHRDLLEGVGEGANCVLLHALDFVCFLADFDRAAELG